MKQQERKIKQYTKKDFAWTQWTPKDIRALVPVIITHGKKQYAAIKKLKKESRTFDNTVYAIEVALYPYADDINRLAVLMNASPEKEVRDAAKDALTELDKRLIDMEHDPGMYRAFMEYKEKRERRAAPEDRKLVRDMDIAYQRMGFDLSLVRQKKLKRILKELAHCATEFSNNINAYHDHITVTREELEGLPEYYIAGLAKDTQGRYRVSLDYPELMPFLANARNAQKRKELAEKNLQRGGARNMVVMQKMLALRHAYAQLLGYRNHVDYRCAVRMANNERTVRRFIDALIRDVTPAVHRDMLALRAAKKMDTGRAEPLRAYDAAYYIEQTKKQSFAIESERLREYFPLEKVLSGTFAMYQALFGVSFTRIRGYPLWHRDVQMYAVSEKGKTISYFFLDLFPREGKFSHACATALVEGKENSDGWYNAPSTVMLANFSRPRGKQPALLSHGEVETFFHEFGHVMHGVLTTAKYRSQSGTSVKRDFVEAPSQMFEHWVWNEKTLRYLSGHYKTGKPLPRAMIRKMLAAKRHMEGYGVMRQLTFALFDCMIHDGKRRRDIAQMYNALAWKLLGVRMPKKAIFAAGFGHFVGYDAGYYSYLWSKVYGDDMFTRFQREGMLNPRTGAAYRSWILEKGSSMDEMDLVKGFLGRALNNKAFLEEIGVFVRK